MGGEIFKKLTASFGRICGRLRKGAVENRERA
jgi:hypothetical protein